MRWQHLSLNTRANEHFKRERAEIIIIYGCEDKNSGIS